MSELEKVADTHDQAMILGDFLDWLGAQGMFLCKYENGSKFPRVVGTNVQLLLNSYFGIDTVKLENERRALIAYLQQKAATGTAQATDCETNGTEGLRAELDAAKRALAEEQAKNESLRDALVYSGFMQHGTQQYMLPVGIGLLNNDWVVVTFPDKSKVDTGPRPRAFEMMRAALAAKSTEQAMKEGG